MRSLDCKFSIIDCCSIQGYKAAKVIDGLKQSLSPQVNVIRDGLEFTLNAQDLVPG